MAEALGVPVITEPVYPNAKSPPIDVVMSYAITESPPLNVGGRV